MGLQKRQNPFGLRDFKPLKLLFLKILHKLFHFCSENLNLFATFDIRELSTQENAITPIKDTLKVGIVIQGPIIPRTTLEICTFYKKIYPNVPIVLSTWEGEDVTPFQFLVDPNFSIIKSVKPQVPGTSNVNFQIKSTIAGIKNLADKGCTHLLKTRTDILLGNPDFINYLIWMHSKGKKNALVVSSFNSFIFRLFSPSDQVMFGQASNLEEFWSIDLVLENQNLDFPEKYLFQNYIKIHGYETKEELNNYLIALRDYTVIADHEQLGQIWNKGVYTSLGYRWRGENFPNRMIQLSAWHWEMLQDDLSYFEELNDSLE